MGDRGGLDGTWTEGMACTRGVEGEVGGGGREASGTSIGNGGSGGPDDRGCIGIGVPAGVGVAGCGRKGVRGVVGIGDSARVGVGGGMGTTGGVSARSTGIGV